MICLVQMASNLPIPLPPRTPTPPPDDPPSAPDNSSRLGAQDKDSLSPLVDSFPPQRGSLNTEGSNRLSPTRASFTLSPSDNVPQNSQGDNGSAGPFNFKTTTMAKSPVVKSVSPSVLFRWNCIGNDADCCSIAYRTLASDVDISISIVVYRTRYSLSHHPGPHWPCLIRCRYRLSRSAVRVCRKNRKRGFGGVCAICLSPHILFGVRTGPWL